MGVMKAKRLDPDFQDLLRKHAVLDEIHGTVKFDNVYASLSVNIGFKGTIVSVSYAHLVWFMKYGKWPEEGKVLDHIDDNPFNNRPENLREVTPAVNAAKRRGRMVYRSYGTGKYGYGINVTLDKRDGRYYVRRHLSRGHGNGELKTIRRSLGGFPTLEAAEAKVKDYIADIESNGLNYLNGYVGKRRPNRTKRVRPSLKDALL